MEINEKRYELNNSILDNLDVSIYVVDPNTFEMIFANKSFFKKFDKENNQINNRKCYEIIHNRTTPCPECNLHKYDDFDLHYYKRYVIDKDIYLKVQYQNIMVNGKKVNLRYGYDITDLEKSIDKENTQNKMLQTAIKNSGLMFWLYDFIRDVSQIDY